MEALDNSNYIIIGKYWISKTILMCLPCQLYVTNMETNECKLYRSHQIFDLLKYENLDPEPLHEYFDLINGITKVDRIRIIKEFEEWEQRQKEKTLMKEETPCTLSPSTSLP